MIGITNKMKVFGLRVMVKRPVPKKGYTIGLESFSPKLLTLNPACGRQANGLPNPNLKTILLAHECYISMIN
jgi:hypothetical protein